MPPVLPMLAKAVKGIPDPAKYGGLSFEPKWDGFRCLVFKDGDEVELASRNTKPLTRYFPEVVGRGPGAAAGAVRARRRAVRRAADGGGGDGWSSRRCRSGSTRPPRGSGCSRRRRRPASWPSTCSRSATTSYLDRPFAERRAALEEALGRPRRGPATSPAPPRTPAEAEAWFTEFEGAGLDGVVAKPLAGTTSPTPAPCSRSSTSAPPTWWSRATASTRRPRPRSRCSAASSSACTPTASCSTSASAPASPPRAGRS